jgi:hypothetical protein
MSHAYMRPTGGDLYEVIGTEHGVRVVMGDVRGHGIAALGTVAAGPLSPPSMLRTVFSRLLRHTGTAPADDALLVLHRDRSRTPGPPRPPAGEPAGHRAHRGT